MFERSDRYLGTGCLLVGALGYLEASKWKVLFATDPAGPGAIPRILCVGFGVLGLILLAGGFTVKKTELAEVPFCTVKEMKMTLALALVCLAYIVVLPILGYLLSTPLLLAAILLTVGVKTPKTIVLISLIGTIVLFLIFYSLLKVNLPMGFMKKSIDALPLRW